LTLLVISYKQFILNILVSEHFASDGFAKAVVFSAGYSMYSVKV